MPDVKLHGIITKVEEGFAYASCDDGSVFIPITACRTPNETLYDLRTKFLNNEHVIIKAQLQTDQRRRNNCKWIAKSVKKGVTKKPVSDVIHKNVYATVISSTDSYAFAESDEFGTIFLPGNAFDATVVKAVHAHVGPKTQLIVDIKEQIEYKGCKYVAVKVTKRDEAKGHSEVLAMKKNEMVISTGIVLLMEHEMAEVECSLLGVTVHCPALAYRGKVNPERPHMHLAEFLSYGDSVQFKAVQSENQWIAISWRLIDGSEEDAHPSTQLSANTQNSETNTVPIIESLVLAHIFKTNPDFLQKYRFILSELPDTCLPEWYTCNRDKYKFDGFQLPSLDEIFQNVRIDEQSSSSSGSN